MELSQLKWRCRRGVRELDVLFTRFVERHYPALNAKDKSAFHEFLTEQDPIIMDWLFARIPCEQPQYQVILDLLQQDSGLSAG